MEEQFSNVKLRDYFRNLNIITFIYVLSIVYIILIVLLINLSSIALLCKKSYNIYNTRAKPIKLGQWKLHR